ncbi:MAG: putative metal-binding motif-containing protein [Candidatus Thiodiazotropha sp. (ex Epidulcina cf. delphinae)]|nr:putative metal-binding motif-containing protein [Candidatus Thiodiazotropha sp. (ex Epidulcina cf. delphinae)]
MAAYNSGNYEFFCPPPVVVGPSPTCTDADFDGYFAEGGSCGTVADFNDNNSSAYPGAPEICDDGIDNDGNGLVDTADANAVGCAASCTDQDGDRYSVEGGSCGPIDCDDNNIAINPGTSEICSDGVDNNCNARVDAADGACATVGFTHPFGWGKPEKQHRDYVDDNGVSECLSCHSIDTTDRNSPTSCYRCHGKEWDDPNTGGNGNTGFTHPFGWDDPEKQHRDYVGDNGVSDCLSCHSIDTADQNSPMSCYSCHGQEWDDPNTGGNGGGNNGFIHPFGWLDPEDSHPDYVNDNGVSDCLSCHSTDTADRDSSMSCYSCHGQEWENPTTGTGSHKKKKGSHEKKKDSHEKKKDSHENRKSSRKEKSKRRDH